MVSRLGRQHELPVVSAEVEIATADQHPARRVDDQSSEVGDTAAHLETSRDAVERDAGIGAAQQPLCLRRPVGELALRPQALAHGDIDRAIGGIQRIACRPAAAAQAQVDVGNTVAQAEVEAEQRRQFAEGDAVGGRRERGLPDASGRIVDEIDAGGPAADGRSRAKGEARLARRQRHRRVLHLGAKAHDLTQPDRDRQGGTTQPVRDERQGRDETRRLHGGRRWRGRYRAHERRLQLRYVEAGHVGVDDDGRCAFAVDAKQRLACRFARAHLQSRDLDLEAVALGRGFAVHHIGTARRNGQADIGPEHRDVGAFGVDLQRRAFGVDAALDRDLAVAEAALQIDVAGQSGHPAVEGASGPREFHWHALRHAEPPLDLQGLVRRRRLEGRGRNLEHHGRPARAFRDGQDRVAHLDVADPREGSGGPKLERTVLAGVRPRSIGRRQHLEVAVAHLAALDQDVGTLEQDAPDLDLAQKQRERVEEQRHATHARQVRPGTPRRIGERDAFGHHRRLAAELDRKRHAGRQFAPGDLADLLGHARLIARQVPCRGPDDADNGGDRHRHRRDHRHALPGNPHPD